MANKGSESAQDLLASILRGGLRTAQLFDKATGGCRLDQACEYLLTAGIFERLAQGRSAVLLEVPVSWANREAKAVRCGRPGKADRRNGRYDIVYYNGNGKPRAVIEVKSSIRNFVKGSFAPDFLRLTNTLKASNGSSYQFCAFVFYATKNYQKKFTERKEKKRNAKIRLNGLMEKIELLALNYVDHEQNGLIRRLYTSSVQYSTHNDEGAWQIGMIVFASRAKQNTFREDLLAT